MSILTHNFYTDGEYLYEIIKIDKITDPVKSVICEGYIIHFVRDGMPGQFSHAFFKELFLTKKLLPYDTNRPYRRSDKRPRMAFANPRKKTNY